MAMTLRFHHKTAAAANKSPDISATSGALFERTILDTLLLLEFQAAFIAFIFVGWHIYKFPVFSNAVIFDIRP